jgi:hypothetical protein
MPGEKMQGADAAAFLLAQSTLAEDADACWIMFSVELGEDKRGREAPTRAHLPVPEVTQVDLPGDEFRGDNRYLNVRRRTH